MPEPSERSTSNRSQRQEAAEHRRQRLAAAENQWRIAPYFSVVDERKARLLILNKLGDELTFEVTALSLDGSPIPLELQVVEPRAFVELDLAEALPRHDRAPSRSGPSWTTTTRAELVS